LLETGGCLIIFPAGAVSTARHVFGPAHDADWHPFAGRLIIDHEAAVLPVRFEGKNSLLFQLASRISPTLRLSLLLPETAGRIGTTVGVNLGDVIPFKALRSFEDPKALIDCLRRLTYAIDLDRTAGPASSRRFGQAPLPRAASASRQSTALDGETGELVGPDVLCGIRRSARVRNRIAAAGRWHRMRKC
jgi:putative hemolysin